MSDRAPLLRTTGHVLLALFFALAALAFAQLALDAWNAKATGRMLVALLAALGGVLLSARRLRLARRASGAAGPARPGTPPA